MEAIAAAYAQTRNAELELRIKDVDWALFEQVYNAVASATAGATADATAQPEIECSVNIITHTGAAQQPRGQARGQQRTAQQADIMTIIYSTAGASVHTSATMPAEPVTKYTRKIVKARHNATAGHIKWSAVVSEEAPLKPFKPANDALVRFKIRASFDFATGADATAGDRASKWRLDLTAIKTGALKDLGPHLKRLREDLFVPVIGSAGALPSGSFIERLPVDLLTSYEIELEYVGASAVTPAPAPAHIEETAQSMLALINPRHNLDRAYQDVMLALAPMIASSPGMFKNPKYKLKQLVPQVVSMTKNEYYADVWPRLADFYVTDKADGERALIVCGLNAGAIVDTAAYIVRSDSLVTISAPAGTVTGTPLTIADAEIICADPKRGSINPQCYTIHIFDCAALEGRLLANEPFSTRVEVLPRCAEVLQAVFNSGASAGDAPQYTVSAKRFTRLAANAAENKQIITAAARENARGYAIDGLIFSSAGDAGASAYANTRHYKWKPYAQNTIDFLAVKCPPALMGVKPYIARDGYELFLLFVGISHTARAQMGIGLLPKYKQIFPDVPDGYYPVQFSTSLLPYAYLWYAPVELTARVTLHRRIVELSRNDVNTEWVFHRVREDRVVSENYYGNDFRTAESSFINFIDPFNIEDLYQRAGSYFEHTADNIYFAQNKFKRYAITQTLKRVIGAHTRWVVDLAAGRGADLHRYQELGVDNALFVDVDATAISELIRRKLALGRRKIIGSSEPNADTTAQAPVHSAAATAHNQCPRPFLTKTAGALTVHTLVADLKRPFADTLASMYQFGVAPNCVDLVVCNFALHYFCDTIENLRNFLQLVKKLLKKDGLAMFSVMSGRKVFDLLANAPSAGAAANSRAQWNSCVSLGADDSTDRANTNEPQECACDLPNAVVKYSIIADYKSAKLEQAGQNIMIKLPFSTTMYSEPLCNLDTVTACAKKLGLAVERNESMGARLSQFEQSNRVLYEKLTADDKKYIDLHHIVVLRAIK